MSCDPSRRHAADFDVVVVGAGVGGLSAVALLASAFPTKRIALVEKRAELGGILAGRFSFAAVWWPQTAADAHELSAQFPKTAKDALPRDDDAAAAHSILEWLLPRKPEARAHPLTGDESGPVSDAEEAELLATLQAAISRLLAIGAVDRFVRSDRVAYAGASTCTYAHEPRRYPLEAWLEVLGTGYLLLSRAGQNLRKVGFRNKADGLLSTPGFVYRLTQFAARQPNVRILCSTEVTAMRRGESERSGSGRRWSLECRARAVLACDHVIFASGGFAAVPELQSARGLSLPGRELKAHSWNDFNTGVLERVADAHGFERSSVPAPRDVWPCEAVEIRPLASCFAGSAKVFAPILFLSGASMLVVDQGGRRVYNERWPYSRRGPVCRANGHLILVLDGRALSLESHSLFPDARSVYPPDALFGSRVYTRARSVASLCSKLVAQGVVGPGFEKAFKAQLEQFAGFAASGVDSQFSRHAYHSQFVAPAAPEMRALDPSDLFACVLHPSALDTCCGPRVDSHNRVLSSRSGAPVEGVHAVGNCAASLTHGFYLAAGIPAASAIAGAHRAVSHIAQSW